MSSYPIFAKQEELLLLCNLDFFIPKGRKKKWLKPVNMVLIRLINKYRI